MKLALLLSAIAVFLPGSSPGTVRVIENGEWVHLEDFVDAKGTVTISADEGCSSVQEADGVLTVSLTWSDACRHTFVNVEVDGH